MRFCFQFHHKIPLSWDLQPLEYVTNCANEMLCTYLILYVLLVCTFQSFLHKQESDNTNPISAQFSERVKLKMEREWTQHHSKLVDEDAISLNSEWSTASYPNINTSVLLLSLLWTTYTHSMCCKRRKVRTKYTFYSVRKYSIFCVNSQIYRNFSENTVIEWWWSDQECVFFYIRSFIAVCVNVSI